MNPPSIEWIAGFFDGEGSVSISPSQGRMPRIQMCIGNSNFQSLEDVKGVLGGYVYIGKQKGKNKPAGQLRWWDEAAVEVLKILLPHLRIRTEPAKNAIAYWELIRAPRQEHFRKRGNWAMQPEYKPLIEEFVTRQRKLNKTGVGTIRNYSPVFIPPGTKIEEA